MILTTLSVLAGAVVPLVLLAALVRWRVAHVAVRAAQSTARRTRARRRASRGNALAWIRDTFVSTAPPVTDADSPATAVVCPHCRYANEAGVFFCRRCGQRIQRLG